MTKAEITLVKSLSDKKERNASGLFIAEGTKLVGEIVASHLDVQKIFFTDDKSTSDTFPFKTGSKIETEKVSPKDMERLSKLKTPSNIIALVKIPNYKFDFQSVYHNLILALDNIQDPGNMGTIIRIADWFGINDIICSENSADCFNPKVVQATMGAITRVKVHYTDLGNTLKKITADGINVYGTFLEGENIYNAQLSKNGVIIMGNEGRGISPAITSYVNKKLFIPSYPAGAETSESLNVSTATAIICSEFRRRF